MSRAPAVAHAFAIAQAMLRLFATPKTRTIFPARTCSCMTAIIRRMSQCESCSSRLVTTSRRTATRLQIRGGIATRFHDLIRLPKNREAFMRGVFYEYSDFLRAFAYNRRPSRPGRIAATFIGRRSGISSGGATDSDDSRVVSLSDTARIARPATTDRCPVQDSQSPFDWAGGDRRASFRYRDRSAQPVRVLRRPRTRRRVQIERCRHYLRSHLR